jgi:VWFA-related protein
MLICVFFLIFPLFSQQERIVEKVDVEWWVIPLFAVDNSGQSITDLKESDIELQVNKQKIENFVLLKKSFSISGQEAPQPGQQQQPIKTKPVPERQKNVFLLFDTALSTKESTQKAAAIARKIVEDAEKNTRFFIMVIEPFTGLVYVGGDTNDKTLLTEIISNKVIPRNNIRVPSYEEVTVQIKGAQTKYDDEDIGYLKMSASKYHFRKSMNFVQSFKSLYYALNSIKDNKFVYLFTEGVSQAMRYADVGNESMYRLYFRQLSDYLGRCGAVLFIINPFGTLSPGDMEASGEESLRFLAKESGGKYLEGMETNILRTIGNMHKAYYEIFFPAALKPKSGVLKISVNCKRSGIDIHTLRAAEKNRNYAQMEPMEREVMALNLISGNPWYEAGLAIEKIEINNVSFKKGKVTYRLNLPKQYVRQPVDLYKIWMDKTGKDTKVEKESLSSAPGKMKITFKKVKKSHDTYFVLIDKGQKSALVHGMKAQAGQTHQLSLPEDTREWATKELMAKEQINLKPGQSKELERLLTGAAQYCEKLKKAAFHYICKEKIAETQKPFARTRSTNLQDLSFSEPQDEMLYNRSSVLDRTSPRRITRTRVEKRIFNYRLIKSGDRVKEERELDKDQEIEQEISKKAGVVSTREAIKRIRFLSGKSIFGPITILSAERQARYHFRFVGHQELQGRPVAVIEALPKSETDTAFVYGKIWIDTENFSILKINANPNSIVGYSRLKKFAQQLNTRLFLDLETEFFKFRDGIRFPTSIRFLETYKGGSLITSRRGTKGWTRTQTITGYTDYMFFNIDMKVTIDKD